MKARCKISCMEESPVTPQTSKSSSINKIRVVILVLIFSVLSLAVGYSIGAKGYKVSPSGYSVNINRDVPAEKKDLDFSLFWNIWDALETSYFDKSKIDESKLVFGAIKGMVSALGDPYTVFLTPDEQRVTQEDLSGNFSGVGIQIGFKGTQLAVVAPLPGSPAEKAGIEAGDLIVGIKDENKGIERGTVGINLPDAVQIIRGEAGSKITLSLLREGVERPIIVDVERAEINVPSVELSFVGPNDSVAHLKVLKFGGETQAEWDRAVLEILKKQNLSGIVLDVRNNPGGYLQGAVDLGSEFLKEGDVVVAEQFADGTKDEYVVERVGRLIRDKVVVLINGGSASASEILAGALRDQKGIKLIGNKSFGKGTVQEAKQLLGEVGLHITIAKWLTPNGTWVHDTGLTPDVEVEDDNETLEDEQLERAISELLNLSYSSGN